MHSFFATWPMSPRSLRRYRERNKMECGDLIILPVMDIIGKGPIFSWFRHLIPHPLLLTNYQFLIISSMQEGKYTASKYK